ncbi:auxin-responsive protein SAUR32 [Senna tora]|uniref:Auxin-responsive protein SAUR32 n=1 Tax=Senna tora TaxID=362788 RepID=A0A835CIV5_9FABA|nr:auxin-responsive protein SAUR32 [Senna tora]
MMVGNGEKSFKSNEIPILTYHHDDDQQRKAVITKDIPKGCLAIKVGSTLGGGDQERIVVPVNYLNHPLFAQLLKEAEEEYGFAQEGAIVIPCQLDHFRV